MPATPVPPVTLPPVTVAAPPGTLPPPPVPPGPVPALPITSEHRTANDACIKRLKQLQIQPSPRVYPKTVQPSTLGTEIDIQTNVFGIEVHKRTEIFQYSVSIKADLTTSKEVVFTKKGKEDFVVIDRHEKCCAILFYALEHHQDFFKTDENCLVYDGQSILYSTIDLFFGFGEGATKTKLLQINGGEIGHKDLERLPCIKLEVFATKNPPVKFSQDDIGRRTSDSNIESINRAYHQILELALNQHGIRDTSKCVIFEHGKMFFIKPLEEGFHPSDCVDVGDGKKMMPGLKKTVQFIEGPYGRGQNNPSVVIDGMKVAFHKQQSVFEKICEITTKDVFNGLNDFDRERCTAVIKGLDCYSDYMQRRRHLKIEGIHHEGAAGSRFQLKDGGTCTVAEYFQDRYKLELKYPKANLVICKDKGNLNFYPMELMVITPNQRVTITQQTSAQSQRTTKESAVLPDIRQRLIMTGKIAAKISSDNQFLNQLGVMVCDEPLVVKARQFPNVKLATQEQSGAVLPMRDNKWRINQYCRPAEAPQIWALYAVGTQSSRFSDLLLKKFGEEFVAMCRAKGIRLSAPGDHSLVLATDIETKLFEAAKAGCKFTFVITDDNITNLHQRYKAVERQSKMIVQDMKMTKAISVVQAGKKLTLENVINKTNVKLGGTNYIFADTKKYLEDNLVIGVGVSNPPAGTKFVLEGKGIMNPMVIGFAYNARKNQEFTGDFVLTPSGQDTMAPIEDIVTHAITGYQKWHDSRLPKRIIVYRSGTSEGNHGCIIAYEIPLARAAISNFSSTIKLIYIAVSKDHTYRFFRSNLGALSSNSSSGGSSSASHTGSRTSSSGPAKPCDLNIGPGISVDYGVTNPACKQFFLNSHITLQGTAKTPLYSVLEDDTNASMNGLEELTFNLCHLHQIVGLSTSLPTPLYVANEYAKRGRNLWTDANSRDPFPRGTGSETVRLLELTDYISYKSAGDLIDRRINA